LGIKTGGFGKRNSWRLNKMTSLDGSKPLNLPCTAAETYYEGYLYKVSSNAMTIITADGDTTVAVCDVSSVDDEQTARAAVSGEKVGFFVLGSSAIVYVASQASQTYALGAAVVNSDSVDGMCAATAGSSGDMQIGHYVGDGETTSTTDGDLVPVVLSVSPELADS